MIERYGTGAFILCFPRQQYIEPSVQNRHERSVDGTGKQMGISVCITPVGEPFQYLLCGNL
ncbi:hypothetical protein D3C74_468780 [compost metagenome]